MAVKTRACPVGPQEGPQQTGENHIDTSTWLSIFLKSSLGNSTMRSRLKLWVTEHLMSFRAEPCLMALVSWASGPVDRISRTLTKHLHRRNTVANIPALWHVLGFPGQQWSFKAPAGGGIGIRPGEPLAWEQSVVSPSGMAADFPGPQCPQVCELAALRCLSGPLHY